MKTFEHFDFDFNLIGVGSDIMTGIMFNTYSPPPGFCFDILCTDEPIIDNPKSPDYNVDKMVYIKMFRFQMNLT